MKPTRSMVFEKDDLRRVNDWIPGDVVVHMLIAAHITILPIRKGTLKPRPRLDISGFPTPAPDARPRSRKSYADIRLPAPGGPLPLERVQTIEERAIAAECLPQILGCGLLAI